MAVQRVDRVEHTYVVTYDISDPARWRRVFRTMKGYGKRLQLSVWQCRLNETRRIEMAMALEEHIDPSEDHVLIFDLGPAASTEVKVESFGKVYETIERRATIL